MQQTVEMAEIELRCEAGDWSALELSLQVRGGKPRDADCVEAVQRGWLRREGDSGEHCRFAESIPGMSAAP